MMVSDLDERVKTMEAERSQSFFSWMMVSDGTIYLEVPGVYAESQSFFSWMMVSDRFNYLAARTGAYESQSFFSWMMVSDNLRTFQKMHMDLVSILL